MYRRGEAPLLPYAEIDPAIVSTATWIAVGLLRDRNKYLAAVGYTFKLLSDVMNERATSDRVRTDFLLCSRAIIHEQKQTFFDLLTVESFKIPEAVYPYQSTRTVEMSNGFPLNIANPFPSGDKTNLRWHLWQTLYMSCRPAHSPYIHLYGKPREAALYYAPQWPNDLEQAHLRELLDGPRGYINQNSVIANPALLDFFADKLSLSWNVWGHSLRQDLLDIVAKPVPVTSKEQTNAGNGR